MKTYIGTQADKSLQAIDGMFALLHKMPKTDVAFNEAKQVLLEKMQTERIVYEQVLWRYVDEEILKNMGLSLF